MSEKSKTVINQLYKYYMAKEREDDEWFLPEMPMLESQAQGLTLLSIADQLQRLVVQLRLPVGEWIEVTPDTLPDAHRICALVIATDYKIFAMGAVNETGQWYLLNFPTERPRPLFYMILPDMTAEMQGIREAEWLVQAKDEEL